MATAPSKGQLLYHITHLDNIENILSLGLMSRNSLIKSSSGFTDIADSEIIQKRAFCEEDLADYVLFHFYAKNPFDYAVTHKYSVDNLAIITIRRPSIDTKDFKIIPSHPIGSESPEILSYAEGFSKIDWKVLDDEKRDYTNSDIKKKCMAECIVKKTIAANMFSYVYVYNEKSKKIIEEIDTNNVLNTQVNPYMFCSVGV